MTARGEKQRITCGTAPLNSTEITSDRSKHSHTPYGPRRRRVCDTPPSRLSRQRHGSRPSSQRPRRLLSSERIFFVPTLPYPADPLCPSLVRSTLAFNAFQFRLRLFLLPDDWLVGSLHDQTPNSLTKLINEIRFHDIGNRSVRTSAHHSYRVGKYGHVTALLQSCNDLHRKGR